MKITQFKTPLSDEAWAKRIEKQSKPQIPKKGQDAKWKEVSSLFSLAYQKYEKDNKDFNGVVADLAQALLNMVR